LLTDGEYNLYGDDAMVFNDFNVAHEFLSNNDNIESIFVIGGKEIIESCLNSPCLKYLYITDIEGDFDSTVSIDNLTKYLDNVVWTTKISRMDELTHKIVDVTFSKFENTYIHPEYQYIDILKKIKKTGDYRKTRNAYTWSVFGESITYDMDKYGFPIITTKRVPLRFVFEELKFFLKGLTDANVLAEKGVGIWLPNTTREFLDNMGLHDYKQGTMGPMYGFNWLHFGAEYKDAETNYTGTGVNQLQYVLDTIKKDPFSRRIMMTTFNPATVKKSVLWPCHGIIVQFACKDEHGKRLLHCNMYQRSCDMICGVPFNISSYGLLVYIICKMINSDPEYDGIPLTPGTLKMYLGDAHIYDEPTHVAAISEHLKRVPTVLPTLTFKKEFTNINDLEWEDIELINYKPHPTLKANMVA
jgi:thymidylate synthase